MKNLLLFAGGALVAVGVYKVWQMSKSKSSSSAAAKPPVVIQTTQVVEPRDPLSDAVRVFNANPAATFAPPKTTIMVPGAMIGEVFNYNMANELVDQ